MNMALSKDEKREVLPKLPECPQKCKRYFGRASKVSDPVCQSKKGSCGNKLSIIGKCPARYLKCRQGHLVKTTKTTTMPSLDFDFDIDVSSSFFPALEVS